MAADPFLDTAIAEAVQGRSTGGIPIGSVLVVDGEIVGRGHNQRVQRGSVVLHAEMDCLENAGRMPAGVYQRATIYSTLSPCAMCTGAILLYGIPRLVVGENQTFQGPQHLLQAAGVEVTLVNDERCINMMLEFIAAEPSLWNEDIGEL
jgi:cytosine deaminase